MNDKQKAIEYVMNFLQDKTKKTLLVKGYDDDAKLKVVFYCLNKEFSKGIIRTSDMSDISGFINRAWNKNLLPYNVTSTANYKLGRMIIKISSYKSHTKSNPKGNKNTFTVFHPVQSVLNNTEKYNEFLNEIRDTASRKVVLITTNDQIIEEWDIENHVDEVFWYDVENDNPELMSTMRDNGVI
ncbi:hypothetical protein BAQ53_24435 [Bacillus sp. B25(2016b)]|uniref:hypothetical protein n=1 Tax=Bacillus sp. B25(2016b) TaxID=1868655 RepID=UPI0008040BBE|nr:hypothetical protein [Bacillus sp. B25(2016b)]ANP83877.1 hypothetical protein BAQ53_24435 [Bacillus sp. B25(2016b)]